MSEIPSGAQPLPFAKITIKAGPIEIDYQGPPEFLKELPALIDVLQKAAQSTPRTQ
jgi:hypothetical protein